MNHRSYTNTSLDLSPQIGEPQKALPLPRPRPISSIPYRNTGLSYSTTLSSIDNVEMHEISLHGLREPPRAVSKWALDCMLSWSFKWLPYAHLRSILPLFFVHSPFAYSLSLHTGLREYLSFVRALQVIFHYQRSCINMGVKNALQLLLSCELDDLYPKFFAFAFFIL